MSRLVFRGRCGKGEDIEKEEGHEQGEYRNEDEDSLRQLSGLRALCGEAALNFRG
jgi:hypothetical protein